jgi:hypothetical protein
MALRAKERGQMALSGRLAKLIWLRGRQEKRAKLRAKRFG